MAAAIEILTDLEVRKRPVSTALRDWGQAHRFAGSGDRAVIGNLVYDVMRKRASHAAAMQSEEPRALVLSVVVRDWEEDPLELNSAFELDKFAPDTITEDEIAKLTAAEPTPDGEEFAQANLPEWLVENFKTVFGDDWQQEASAFAKRPPLDMRVNALKSKPDRVLKSLSRFSPELSDFVPNAIRIAAGEKQSRTANVQADESFQKGWIEIQDLGSQCVAFLSAAKPGEHILDLCAGAGGKTLALAAMTQNKGQIFAYDTDRNRLAPIYDRLKRNGIRNTQVRAPADDALDDLKASMDKVIVDAPCTGTGTWRRHPDAKWRLTAEQVQTRVEQQQIVLSEATEFVKAGGELVYITCSILPQENIEQIQSFIENNGLFAPIDMRQRWADTFPDATLSPHFDTYGATLSPHGTGTDGFYISILKRKSD